MSSHEPQGAPSRSFLLRVYAALAAVQVIFCIGAVYLKLSLTKADGEKEALSPVIFALWRETLAAGPLLGLSKVLGGVLVPTRLADAGHFALLGLFLFVNQLFFLFGVDLSGVVVATCMQPTIPVFTTALAVLIGVERFTMRKTSGILLAVVGAICMVLGGTSRKGGADTEQSQSPSTVLGNLCLVVNCLSMACYYLAAKQLLLRFHSSTVTAYAYVGAAFCMLCTALATVPVSDWKLPAHAIGPLIYWAFVCSVLGYFTITWSASYLPASRVAAFQCLQPFVGTMLGWAVLGEPLTPWDLGAIGIVAGLVVVVLEEKPPAKLSKEPANGAAHNLAADVPMDIDDVKDSRGEQVVLLSGARYGSQGGGLLSDNMPGLSSASILRSSSAALPVSPL